MGSDPSTSVVNKYLQSWDVSNLFVVGGSAFPQNPANGPTETIGMLACGPPMRSRTTFATRTPWSEQRREPLRQPRNLLVATRFPTPCQLSARGHRLAAPCARVAIGKRRKASESRWVSPLAVEPDPRAHQNREALPTENRFSHRLIVAVNWLWSYLTFQRGAKIIVDGDVTQVCKTIECSG